MSETRSRHAVSALHTLPYGLRLGALLALAAVAAVLVLARPPISQDPAYHAFADMRAMLGVPNALDVLSNLPFLLVGVAGLWVTARRAPPESRVAWLMLFAGVALVSAGSAYYHLAPDNVTMVYDRLPMAVGFMGFFIALVAEIVWIAAGRWLLLPALALGLASVLIWAAVDDLRLYICVQFVPLVMVPGFLLLFRARYSHRWLLVVALLGYAAAKATELQDVAIFDATSRLVSGHTIKHLLAALSCLALVVMLQVRRPLPA